MTDDSSRAYVTEQAFLLVELRYALAQLQTQQALLDDLANSDEAAPSSVRQIRQCMSRYESRYQREYASILNLPVPETNTTFERMREHTIAMLETGEDAWPESLSELVKRHAAEDREHVTRIAECRHALLARRTTPSSGPPDKG
jgi:hypothetical protein